MKTLILTTGFLPQAPQEGECQQFDPAEVGPSLVEVVQRPSAYHHLTDTITVFDSTGWALEESGRAGYDDGLCSGPGCRLLSAN